MLRTRAEALDDLERQMRSEADFAGERIVRTGNGFRLQETKTFTVQVWKMLSNWRLVVMLPHLQIEGPTGTATSAPVLRAWCARSPLVCSGRIR